MPDLLKQTFAEWGRGGRYDQGFGVADELRCVAMVVQAEQPKVTRAQFLDVAEALGYNRKTASRCWSFVQE
jgi:hypothetical protein